MDGLPANDSLQEKLRRLSDSFRPFCKFPCHSGRLLTPRQIEYIDAITRLFGLDPIQLDAITEEIRQEWQLKTDMSDDRPTSEEYILELTERINIGVQNTIDDLTLEFRSSELSFLQDESMDDIQSLSAFNHGNAPSAARQSKKSSSFDTELPDFIFSENPDEGSASTFSSPIASMERLGIVSPESPKRRRLNRGGQSNRQSQSFLERLQTLQNLNPDNMSQPRYPYAYGKLPFHVDWEVWRVDKYGLNTSLGLDNVENFLPALREHSKNPKLLWSLLRSRAALNQLSSKTAGFPQPSSARAWEIIESKGWKDGRVHFSLKLNCADNGACSYEPKPIYIASSCRAYRKFGSDRFLTVKIPEKGMYKFAKKITEFIKQPISACGRTYRVFFIKASSAHYFATEGPGLEDKDISLRDLMEWLIALNHNSKMTAPKLFSRIGLSLSSTIPTIVFTPDQIHLVDDITSPFGECMTDGCARMSPAVARELWQSGMLGSKETPTAVQARIGGAKGVWYVDPLADPRSEEMWIQIRRGSQLKFKHDPVAFQDPSLRTLDVCRTSGCKFGGLINIQLIGILSHCGVPNNIFRELLESDLQESLGVVNTYLDNPVLLREWISAIGNIYEVRCLGASYTETASGEELEQEPRCITYWSDKTPTMPHEVCISLLEAGFLPKTNQYLRNKFKVVLKKACEKMSGKMHISVPKSTSLICIADDLGILEEDQVSIRFNKPFMDEQTGRYSSAVVGDVLVARNPALLPTDIQKVKAVDCPQLSQLTDVIVFSTKGPRSILSMLSGGDYDGDLVWTCWDERLVKHFRNANKKFSVEPDNFLSQHFEQDKRPVTEIAGLGSALSAEKLIDYGVSRSLTESKLGACTNRHETVVYTHGHDHPYAVALARLASRLVDAPKQGLCLKMDKWSAIEKRMSVMDPPYMNPFADHPNKLNHVMDILVLKTIPQFQNHVLQSFNEAVHGNEGIPIDPDIKSFYDKVKILAPQMIEDLRIPLKNLADDWKKHVGKKDTERRHLFAQNSDRLSPRKQMKRSASAMEKDDLDEYRTEYERITTDDNSDIIGQMDNFGITSISFMEKVKAATAYCLDVNERWNTFWEPNSFVWSVGGLRALCEIKCCAVMARNASNLPPRMMTEEMYISLKSNSSFCRLEKQDSVLN